MRITGSAATAALLVVRLSVPAAGQVGSASLTVTVRDTSGGAIAGAAVAVVSASTGAERVGTSGRAGVLVVPALQPGEYRVAVSHDGFEAVARPDVELGTGETRRLVITLVPSGIVETVTVAGTPVVQDTTAALGQLVEERAVDDLPLNGRNFVSLAALAPGVALPPGSSLPRINGGRPRTNEYLFDGISVLQPEPGQVAIIPVIDAIQEFKIESNSPPAEFGRFNGGVVNLTTKSGSNDWRGDLFEFFRHEGLNARNYFSRSTPAKPLFRRNQFGGVAGGPLVPGRTFVFADYQGQRQAIGRTVTSTVPTLLQRQGIFTEAIAGTVPVVYDPATTGSAGGEFARTPFPGNTIPADRLDPVAVALLGRYPRPTRPGTANNFSRLGVERDDQDQWDVRVDQRLAGGRDLAFARLSHVHDTFLPVAPLPDGSGATSGTLGPQRSSAWSLASTYRRIVSDRMLNEARFGDTRRSVDRDAVDLPTYFIGGYQHLGSPPDTSSAFGTSVTELVDVLSWQRGRHALKAGLDVRWERLNIFQPPSPEGAYRFSSLFTDQPGVPGTGTALASFLLGQVQSFSIDFQQRQIRNRAHVQEYFLQDDWTVSDAFTVNAGVRYTLNFPSYEADNQAAVFNLDTEQLEYLGQDGHPRAARRLHKLDFGPRLGAVWRAREGTVVRSGYGLIWIEMAGITTPFTTPSFPFLQTVTDRSLDNVTPAFALADGPTVQPIPLTPDAGLGQGVFAVDRDLGSGYAQQWNVAIEHALSHRTTVTLAYVGSKITRVGIPDSNLNQLRMDQLALGNSLLESVPNPSYGTIPASSSIGGPTISRAQLLKPYPRFTTVSLYRDNIGTTSYQGLEARLERRFSHGISFRLSYTRSHLVDDASSVFSASVLTGPVENSPVADNYNRALDRDISSGDIPNVFVSNLVWDVRGWTVSALLQLQSGLPVAVTQATNFNAFAGFGIQRPNLVGDPRLPPAQRTPEHWFDTGAFATAPVFTLGTSSRNPVRGPAYRTLDLALIRRIALGSAGPSLEARVEVFNALNTPPLGQPNGVLGSASFGSITTAGDPRVVQLAVKLLF